VTATAVGTKSSDTEQKCIKYIIKVYENPVTEGIACSEKELEIARALTKKVSEELGIDAELTTDENLQL
jgi:hypothetical protein